MSNFSTEVLVSGVFNILHAGHIELLEYASQLGKVTVGVNGEEYCKSKYGENTISVDYRRYCLSACRYVHDVVVFEEPTPSELILRIRPKYYVKGYDYVGRPLPEEAALQLVGTETILFGSKKIRLHTSKILLSQL